MIRHDMVYEMYAMIYEIGYDICMKYIMIYNHDEMI